MELRQRAYDQKQSEGHVPSKNTPTGWYELGCRFALNGLFAEAERAIRTALEIQTIFPKGWIIFSAVLLSQGKETEAEKAGKMALSQCPSLKMTWPKLRSIMLSSAIKREAGLKSSKKLLLEQESTSKWAEVLAVLDADSGALTDEHLAKDDRIVEDSDAKGAEVSSTATTQISQFVRESIPSISSRKVEGLTKFTVEKLLTESDSGKKEDIATTSKEKPQALPIFSAKKVLDPQESTEQKIDSEIPTSEQKPSHSGTPESSESWFRMGEFHLRKANWNEAEKAFMRVLALEPKNSIAWTRVGSLLMKKGKYDDAKEAFRTATKYSYKNAEAWYLLGFCLQQQSKWAESIVALKTAVNLEQSKAEYWFKLGEAEFNTGQYQDASRSFLRTLRIVPEHKDAMFFLAMCMERRGNRQHALSLYIKLLNSGGLSAEMLERMSGAFERLNRSQEAREARRRAAIARKTSG